MRHLACIATVPERYANLKLAVESLWVQAGIEIYPNQSWGSLPGDYGKFHWLGKVDCDFYFTCDDDLLYPPDYCAVMARWAEHYETVVTLHGRTYEEGDQASYYKGGHTYRYRCLDTVVGAHVVDVPGSGVSCIPRHLQPVIADAMPECRAPNAADLHLALACKNAGIRPVVVPHLKGWLRALPDGERTIYREVTNGGDESVQVELLNEVLA